MSTPIHTIRPTADHVTVRGAGAEVEQTSSGLSVVRIGDNSPTFPAGAVIRPDNLAVVHPVLVQPEQGILTLSPGDTLAETAILPHGLNQAEVVRFFSNPLLYVCNKLLEQIEEPTLEQELLLKMLFEDMELRDTVTYGILVQPKVTKSEYFDKRAGRRLPVEHTVPSEFEEMAINILEILATVGDVPNTPGIQLVLGKLTSFGINAIKVHEHSASEYSQDIISLRGGRVYKAGYEVLEKSILSKGSRKELYRFLDLFEVSTEFAESILERMDALGDLETPLASRLLVNVLHKAGEHRTPFVQEQIRRARVIKEVYEEATPLERGSYSFMETLCKMAKGVVFDIEALEGNYGKQVGFEVEFRTPVPNGPTPLIPKWLQLETFYKRGMFEIKTTNENIELGTSYLLSLDNLRRYLNLYARKAQGSSHMHWNVQDFPEPCTLLGKVVHDLNKDDLKEDTWELRGGLPIDLFHENNISTFINFMLYHTSATNQILSPANIPIETTQHAQWLMLERITTGPGGLIAKLTALNTNTLLSLLGSIDGTSFFEAWATLPEDELLGYLRAEETLYNHIHADAWVSTSYNVADFIYRKPIYITLTTRARALLLQQYGSDLVERGTRRIFS